MGNKLDSHGYQSGFRITHIDEKSSINKYKLKVYFDFIVDVLEKTDDFVLERDFIKLFYL